MKNFFAGFSMLNSLLNSSFPVNIKLSKWRNKQSNIQENVVKHHFFFQFILEAVNELTIPE